MKFLYKISFLALFMTLLFTACQKENIDEITPEDPGYTIDTIEINPFIQGLRSHSADSIILDCIRIPYPIDFLQASGSIITINNEAELDSAGMLQDTIVDFVYPFEAVDSRGVIMIDSIEDLATALVLCQSGTADVCDEVDAHVLLFYNAFNIFTVNQYDFEVEFPFTLIVEGNRVVVNNEDEYIPAIGGNPSRFLEVEIVYPVTVTQFGREIVLESDDDVCDFHETLGEPCENKPAHIQYFYNEGGGVPINCAYYIPYPVEITLDGNTILIQDGQDYRDQLDTSPDAYDEIELVYPVNIIKFQTGRQLRFDSDDEICEYLNNCR